MKADDSILSIQEKYADIAKRSLIRVQYSCSGNSSGFEESDLITYRTGSVEDLPEIIKLLGECELPYSDIVPGNQNFVVAEIDNTLIGCAGFEVYQENGLFRSLAVSPDYRNLKIAHFLIEKSLLLGQEQGIQEFYLLTTTAGSFFDKLGWEVINRNQVPGKIENTSEFTSICPSAAICMKYQL